MDWKKGLVERIDAHQNFGEKRAAYTGTGVNRFERRVLAKIKRMKKGKS